MKKLFRLVLLIVVIGVLAFAFHDEIADFAKEKLGTEKTEEISKDVKNLTKKGIEKAGEGLDSLKAKINE